MADKDPIVTEYLELVEQLKDCKKLTATDFTNILQAKKTGGLQGSVENLIDVIERLIIVIGHEDVTLN